MEKNVQININQESKVICDNLLENGMDVVKELFIPGETMQEILKINPVNEYLKRMLIAQMNLGKMLLTHKYYNTGFEGISDFREESDKIRKKVKTDSVLNFDEDTIELLFGNSFAIKSKQEYENLVALCYYDGLRIEKLCAEEKFKYEYESESNPIKKIIKSFKYKKILKQDILEDLYMKKVRKLISEKIIANPEKNISYIIDETRSEIIQSIEGYQSLQELESISKITLNSLQQEDGKIINLEEECLKTRRILNEDNPSKYHTNYRQRQVTLGTDRGISTGPVIETIPFEEIPESMKHLQERYENAYNTAENEDEYIREVTKIYADYIYMQPYEDGNKRTATCLLNSMLLSKGIIPPPISLANGNEELGEAFSKAHDKDYTMLQDIILSECKNIKSITGENNSSEMDVSKVNSNKETEKNER